MLLYTNNGLSKKEIKKILLFTMPYEYLGVNLTKNLKDLYAKNYKA
jgi:hypothetical protein